MKIEILILVIVLALILTISAFFIILKKNKKPTKVKTQTQEIEKLDFEDLMAIVKNPNSTSKDILNALKLFNENFVIDETNSQKYLIFFSRALTHKNVNAEVFRYFHNEIKKKNLKYKTELESIEKKALG